MERSKNDWSLEWSCFKNGNRESFQKIYDHFFDRLFQYGCKLTSNTQLVEDCIQELFLTIYTNRNNLSDTDYVEFYLLKALKLTVYGKMRKEKRMPLQSWDKEEFNLEFLIETEEQDSIEQRKIELILKTINELGPAAREIIYLKFYTELDYQQIGTMLDIKPDSAKKQIYRIVSSIRSIIKDKVFELPNVF